MITAVMIGYYIFAAGLIIGVGYFTYKQSGRELTRSADAVITRLEQQTSHLALLEPRVREPLLDSTDTVTTAPSLDSSLTLTIDVRLEPDPSAALRAVAGLVLAVDELERDAGGDGVHLDVDGSGHDEDRVTVRLLPRRLDDGAADRMDRVIAVMKAARRLMVNQQATRREQPLDQTRRGALLTPSLQAVNGSAI